MGSHLPAHLFQTYASYKTGTRDVVQWLYQITNYGDKRYHADSIWELEHLTNVAVQKRIRVPSEILLTLRRTIKARTKIGGYFKSFQSGEHQAADSSHAHFTIVLQSIYKSLHDLAHIHDPELPQDPSRTSSLRPSNIFEWLNCDHCCEDGTFSHEEHRLAGDRKASPLKECFAVGNNDVISEFMALTMYLSQLEKLLCVVQDSWRAAAARSNPVVVASFTTSISYQSTEPLRSYLDEYNIKDPEQLLARYNSCTQRLAGKWRQPGEGSQSAEEYDEVPFSKVTSLIEAWYALQEFKKTWRAKMAAANNVSGCTCEADPATLRTPFDDPKQLLSKTPAGVVTDTESRTALRHDMDMILERMGKLINLQSKTAARTTCQTPLLAELTNFLQGKDDKFATRAQTEAVVDSVSLSFGLILLLESLRCYYLPPEHCILHRPPHQAPGILSPSTSRGSDPQTLPIAQSVPDESLSLPNSLKTRPERGSSLQDCPPPSNCRVSSLSFARDIKVGIEQLLKDPNAPCSCLEIGNRKVLVSLANCYHLVTEFSTVKNFDLFHQAPWVSGMDLLHDLMRVSDCGLKSWHHGYFVGTVMHIYNCLVILDLLHKIPVMESLCSIFSNTVFLGPRPQQNLWSCYQRWSGARLSFPGKKCHDMHTHSRSVSRKKWSMESVRDISQGGDDSTRSFDPQKVSLLASMMNKNSVTDDVLLVRIYTPTKTKNPSRNDIQRARKVMQNEPFIAQHILNVQEVVLEEFRDESPVAKINYFLLYEIFCEILRRISSVDHVIQERGQICSCITQRLICEADRQLEDPHIIKIIKERDLVKNSVQAFLDVLQDKTLLDFTWKL